MSSTISRRGVVAALAVGVAVNVPAIAMTAKAPAGAPTASEPHPDAEMLDLGRQYDAALEAGDAASETWTAACAAFDWARRVLSPAMRHRILDHLEHQFPVLGDTDTVCDDERSDFYNEAGVDYLRAMPIRADNGRAGRGDHRGLGRTMTPATRSQRPSAMTMLRRHITTLWTLSRQSAMQSSPHAPRRSTA